MLQLLIFPNSFSALSHSLLNSAFHFIKWCQCRSVPRATRTKKKPPVFCWLGQNNSSWACEGRKKAKVLVGTLAGGPATLGRCHLRIIPDKGIPAARSRKSNPGIGEVHVQPLPFNILQICAPVIFAPRAHKPTHLNLSVLLCTFLHLM